MKVFIGYDSREDIAYQVCKHSILSRTEDVDVEPLKLSELKEKGIYTREDDPLSSTEFTFSRFLVPYLMNYSGWAIFADCDFVFLEDVKKLFNIAKKYDYAVMCAMHDYKPTNSLKMDNKQQFQYPRKNWSSLMIFNCGHPALKELNPEIVNKETGEYLHRFKWLKDDELGAISHEWNWLVNWYKEPENGIPKALHFTEGGPWFSNYLKTEYGAVWMEEKYKYLESINSKARIEEKNEFESIPNDVRDLFTNILKYKVDPEGLYYNHTQENIIEQVKTLEVNNIVSSDSEFRYERKGMHYDPILQNFVLGAGGQINTWDKIENDTRPVVLRGITKRKQMRACEEQGRDYYYIDTGYFGNGRKKLFHRITKNAMQNIGPIIKRPADRFDATGISVTKFRLGSKILLCPPSDKVMKFYDLNLNDWVQSTIDEIKKHTDREIIIRLKKGRAERQTTDTMEMALSKDILCLVTFNSIAATEALLLGKPAFTLGPNAAQNLCLSDLSKIETPYVPTLDEVFEWACHLAYSQFTEDEMRNGTAWKILTNV